MICNKVKDFSTVTNSGQNNDFNFLCTIGKLIIRPGYFSERCSQVNMVNWANARKFSWLATVVKGYLSFSHK